MADINANFTEELTASVPTLPTTAIRAAIINTAKIVVRGKRIQQSIMRRSVAMEMDKFDKRTKIERIIARRGSFKTLPVLFSNDLVHGSWCVALSSNYHIQAHYPPLQ